MSKGYKLLHGAGDLLSLLDDVREQVLKGEVEGLSLSFVTLEGHFWYGNAWVQGAKTIWARLVAAGAQAQHQLVSNGLVEKK